MEETMPTWREISVEARARGEFTNEDRVLWRNPSTCPAAEIAQHYGLNIVDHRSLWRLGRGLGDYIEIDTANCDAFDRLLDEMEDHALALKRGLGVSA